MILSPVQLNNTGVVILAAGRGTRLGCIDKPKVMLEVNGKPIVSYVVETLRKIGFNKEQIMLVVGFAKEKIQEYFGESVSYSIQEEQLGTAHAAYIGIKNLNKNIKNVLVLNGDDSLFYKMETLENFINDYLKNNLAVSLLTAPVEAENYTYGRVIKNGGTIEIIEKEYLTDEIAKNTQTSTGTFIFNKDWFLQEFPYFPKIGKLGEYGLPTAFAVAQKNNLKIGVIKLINKNEWFGINTPKELAEANLKIMNDKN